MTGTDEYPSTFKTSNLKESGTTWINTSATSEVQRHYRLRLQHVHRHALDFARGYIGIFQDEIDKPILVIKKNTTVDIRKKINEVWPLVVEETLRRHKECNYGSHDYFL